MATQQQEMRNTVECVSTNDGFRLPVSVHLTAHYASRCWVGSSYICGHKQKSLKQVTKAGNDQ